MCACVHWSAEYLNERLGKLLDEAVTERNWFDTTATWVMLLSLRSKITSECGQHIIDIMIQDDALLEGIGRVHQLHSAVLDDKTRDEMVMELRKGPSQHLKNHAYEYRRKIDTELALIKRNPTLSFMHRPIRTTRFSVCVCGSDKASLECAKGLKELQLRAFTLAGSAIVATMVGAANFLTRVLYAKYYTDDGG